MIIQINGYDFTPKTSTFPGGEKYIKLEKGTLPLSATDATIVARIRPNKDSLEEVLLATDILRRLYKDVNVHLDLGYLPYARQDRVCEVGESFSLKVFCGVINAQNYSTVTVTDCHSEVGLALLDNVVHIPQHKAISSITTLHNALVRCDAVIAPDAGAGKKAQAMADLYNKPLVQCIKQRTKDGVTISIASPIYEYKNLIVVDDICDGGATFIALAEAIKHHHTCNLALFVTHGIFSKGKKELEKYYTRVEAYDDWLVS